MTHMLDSCQQYRQYFGTCVTAVTAKTLSDICVSIPGNADLKSILQESASKTQMGNAERHRSTDFRRTERAVFIQLGSLSFLLDTGSSLLDVDAKSLRDNGLIHAARISGTQSGNPLMFLSICRSLDKSLIQFPIVMWVLFLIRAAIVLHCGIRFRSDDNGQRSRATTIFRSVWSHICPLLGQKDESLLTVENVIKLFEMWDDIFPATVAYDKERLERILAVWTREQDGRALTTPTDWESILFDDEKDWFPLARSLSGGIPSPSLSALIHSYKVTRDCCVSLESESDGQLALSFLCYQLNDRRPQLRCVHLQATLVHIWETLTELASKLAEEATSIMQQSQNTSSFDDALGLVVSRMLVSIYILAATSHDDGRLFKAFHEELCNSIDWRRTEWIHRCHCELGRLQTGPCSDEGHTGVDREDCQCRKTQPFTTSVVTHDTS